MFKSGRGLPLLPHATLFLFCVTGPVVPDASVAASIPVVDKVKITKQDDLPRHTYEVTGDVVEMVRSWEALAPLAEKVRADLESDLATYDIQDKTTLKSMHGTLVTLGLLEGRHDDVLARLEVLRALEDKESIRLAMGLGPEARIAATRDVGTDDAEAFVAAYGREYRTRVEALPFEVVQDILEQSKSQMEMLSENLILGIAEERVAPVVAESGEASLDLAAQIIRFHSAIHLTLPVKSEIVAVLQNVIDANRVEKEDIWAARDLDLTGQPDLEPVLVAVWDTGVDPEVFGPAMFTNPGEKADGKDTDGNGFVDDVHGIAFDLHWNRTSGPLYAMDEATRPVPELQAQSKGLFDMRAAIDSPEAVSLREQMATLGQEEVRGFLEDLTRYTLYSHGTHVAGIAAAGNPAARVMYCRLTGDASMIPEPPTMEDVERGAVAVQATVDYFKAHDVRVVNMSWVVSRSSFEQELEANNIGTPEERKQMAREMFDVVRAGLQNAFESAPDILFVGGAGNSDNDVSFDEFVPPMLELPNLLIAGAVDQAGEPTTFTSFGSTVNVYSNGFEVESFVPGGDRVKYSGTSMASPNVANLAAKLIALDPELTPAETMSLILQGADEVAEGEVTMRIINPKRSAELLRDRAARASM